MDRVVEVAEPAVRGGHRKCSRQAGSKRVTAFDVAHSRFELCVVRCAAASGGAGCRGAAGGSVNVIHSARVPAALFCDMGFGSGTGGLPGGGAYCAGAIWSVSFFEAVGRGDRDAGAARRQGDDLWRSGVRVVTAILSAAAD